MSPKSALNKSICNRIIVVSQLIGCRNLKSENTHSLIACLRTFYPRATLQIDFFKNNKEAWEFEASQGRFVHHYETLNDAWEFLHTCYGRFIKSNAADVFETRFLARGSTVIIDGNGWIFSLLQRPQARTIMVLSCLKKYSSEHCITSNKQSKVQIACCAGYSRDVERAVSEGHPYGTSVP